VLFTFAIYDIYNRHMIITLKNSGNLITQLSRLPAESDQFLWIFIVD